MDFPELYRAALQERAGSQLALDEDIVEGVLDLARDVAHATERRYAPLSTFLTGQYVAARVAQGASAEDAVREAQVVAAELT